MNAKLDKNTISPIHISQNNEEKKLNRLYKCYCRYASTNEQNA